MKIFVVFCSLVLVVTAQPAGHGHNSHGHGGSVPGPAQVDAAIVNIELHYNDKLCLEILLVDCTKHVTQGDEQVCGSNGITYDNHCKFAHAMCEFAHSDNEIGFASHGACPTGTAAPPATSTAPVATQAGTGPVAITTTTAAMPTTTTAAATTIDPIHSILENVFCQSASTISCANEFQILCGSDGQLYPNQCELSKQKCKDPTLTIADKSTCPVPGK